MSGIPSWARPGVKVMCINGHWHPRSKARQLGVTTPASGSAYTIRKVTLTRFDKEPGVLLEEIINTQMTVVFRGIEWNGEPRFGLDRFRPLTEVSETDETEAELYHKKHLHARRSERERA